MIKDYSTLQFKDQSSNIVQDNVRKFFEQIKNCPLIDGVLLKDVYIPGSNTQIAHKLFRVPTGYIVTKNSSFGVMKLISMDKDYITLIASTASTVDIWIF